MTTQQNFINRIEFIINNNKAAQWVAIIKLKHDNRDLYVWLLNSTSFLSETVKVTERIFCIINSITEIKVCKICGKVVTFRDYAFGYNTYCSPKCSANDPDSKVRKEKTCLEKYGTKHYLSTKDADVKRRATNLEKYGVENVAHMEGMLERKKKGCLKKYGQAHQMHVPEVIEKIKQTNMERHGVSNYMNSPEVLARNKEKYGSEYFMCTDDFKQKKEEWLLSKGVANTSQVSGIQEKVKETSRIRYGTNNHMQKYRINTKYWNDINFIRTEFIKGKRVNYTKAKLFFNASYPTLLYHFKNDLGLDIKNTNVDSEAEREIVHFIKANVSSIEVIQNSRSILKYEKIHADGRIQKKYKELDIYLPKDNIAIEFDGLYYHSIGTVGGFRSEEADIKRLRTSLRDKATLLEEKGIHFLNIWENEWNDVLKHTIWKATILKYLKLYETIYVEDCTVVEIDRRNERNFLMINHLQGDCAGSVKRYGLVFEGVLLAIMTFGYDRHRQNESFELLRFSTLLGYYVSGGAEKLLDYFIAMNDEKSLLFYGDRRFTDFSLYKSLSFELQHIVNPICYYFDPSKAPVILIRKDRVANAILKDKLPIFDPALTEQKNMFANGYRAVYDAGQAVYKLTI